jgi:hypothetical protein
MGLTLEFYIGDPKKISNALRKGNLDLLYDDPKVVSRTADLSLHILPKDLNLLSMQFGQHSKQRPLELRPNLKVLIDEEDYGLLLVNKKWVKYAAKVAEDALGEIVSDWFEVMKSEYPNEEIEKTEEARLAVQELLMLCKEAVQKKSKVLHAWYL